MKGGRDGRRSTTLHGQNTTIHYASRRIESRPSSPQLKTKDYYKFIQVSKKRMYNKKGAVMDKHEP